MLSEVECDEVEDGEGSETSMKGFTVKTSISEMVSLAEGEKTVEEVIMLDEGTRGVGEEEV